MTRKRVKAALDRVLAWPPERQADVARVVELMEEQDSSVLRLSAKQVAEVRRRMGDRNPKLLTLGQFKAHLRSRYSG